MDSTTNYYQIWWAKDSVFDWYLGTQWFNFHLIPPLLDNIQEVDPNAMVDLSLWEGSILLHRTFICLGGTKNAPQCCEPFVCLDAYH